MERTSTDHADTSPPTPKTLLGTVADVAKETGIKRSTLYEGLAAGTIPGAVKFGRRILVHRPTITRWIEEQANGGAR